jgi:hypothetical protein
MPGDDEFNWLFNYKDNGDRIVHPDDEDLDGYGTEPSEVETDPQYGSLDRFYY